MSDFREGLPAAEASGEVEKGALQQNPATTAFAAGDGKMRGIRGHLVGELAILKDELAEAISCALGAKLDEALRKHQEQAAVQIIGEQLAAEKALRLQAEEAIADLRAQVAQLHEQLAAAKEEAARQEGMHTSQREAVETYMLRLDEERLHRRGLEAKLAAADEELLTLQRNLHLMSLKLDRKNGSRNAKTTDFATQDVVNRLELVLRALAAGTASGSKPLSKAEAARLETDLIYFATVGALVPVLELLKSPIKEAHEPAALALVANLSWTGGVCSEDKIQYLVSTQGISCLVRLLQEPGPTSAAAVSALQMLSHSCGAEGVCEALSSEGAVAPLVQLLPTSDIPTQGVIAQLMLQLCRQGKKYCAALALAGGITALLPLISLACANEHTHLSETVCEVFSCMAAANHSSRVALMEAGGIPPLYDILMQGPSELHGLAAKVIGLMADASETQGQLLCANVVEPLIHLLGRRSMKNCLPASLAICNLSLGITDKVAGADRLFEPDVCKALIDVLRWCFDPSIVRYCSQAVDNLITFSDEIRYIVLEMGGAAALVRTLEIMSPQTMHESADSPDDGPYMAAAAAAAGSLSHLIPIMDDIQHQIGSVSTVAGSLVCAIDSQPQSPGVEKIVQAAASLAERHPDDVLGAGIVSTLVKLLRSSWKVTKEAAASALSTIQRAVEDKAPNIQVGDSGMLCIGATDGVMAALVQALQGLDLDDSTNVGLARSITSATHNLMCSTQAAGAFVDVSGVAALLDLITPTVPDALSVQATKTVLRTVTLLRDSEMAMSLVPYITELFNRDLQHDLQVIVLQILQQMAVYSGCSDALAASGAITYIMHQIRTSSISHHQQIGCAAVAAMVGHGSHALSQQVVDLDGIQLLVPLLSARDAVDNRGAAAAAALGALAFDGHSDLIVDSGAIPTLIELLHEGGDACRNAADALLNLADEKSRDVIASAGAVESLLALISEPYSELTLTAVITLNNLASSAKSRKLIADLGGVDRLVATIQVADIELSWHIAQHAAWTLTKVGCNRKYQELIKAKGGSEKAMALVRGASDTLARLVENQESTQGPVPLTARIEAWCAVIHLVHSVVQGWREEQTALLRSDDMRHFVRILHLGNCELQEAVAGLILELVESEKESEHGIVLHQREQLLALGVVEPLTKVLLNGSSSPNGAAEKEFAAKALSHLVASHESKAVLCSLGGLAALVGMLNSKQLELFDAAALALEALATDGQLVEPIIDAGAVPALVAYLSEESSPDGLAKQTAMAVLMHLSANSVGCSAVFLHGALTLLLQSLTDESTAVRASAGVILQNMAADMVIGPKLCTDDVVGRLKILLETNSSDDITQNICAMLVLNLTESRETHASLLKSGIVASLIAVAKDAKEEDSAESSVLALVRLCEGSAGVQAVHAAGGTEALCLVLNNRSLAVQYAAARALFHLVAVREAWSLMLQMAICPTLENLLESCDDRLVIAEINDGFVVDIAELNLQLLRAQPIDAVSISRLQNLMDSKSEGLHQVAAGSICSLAENQFEAVIGRVSQLPQLIRVLASAISDKRLTRDGVSLPAGRSQTWLIPEGHCIVNPSLAAWFLTNVAEDEKCAATFVEYGGANALLEAIMLGFRRRLPHPFDTYRALKAVHNLAGHEQFWPMMASTQGVLQLTGIMSPQLEGVLSGNTDYVQGLVLSAQLLMLCANHDATMFEVEFAEAGGIPLLTKMLQTGVSTAKQIALQILSEMQRALGSGAKDTWDCVPVLVKAVQTERGALQLDSIRAVRKLAKDPKACAEFVSCGVVSALCEQLGIDDETLQEASLRTLRTIAAEQVSLVVSGGAVHHMIRVLKNSSDSLRKEGLLGLLTVHDDEIARTTLHNEGGVNMVVEMLHDPNAEIRECAAKVLHALAMHEESRTIIAETGGLEAMVSLLDVQGEVSTEHEAAALALQTLAYDNPENGQQLADSGAHHKLLELLESAVQVDDINTQAAAGTALLHLAQVNEDVRNNLVEVDGGVELIVEVLERACTQEDSEEAAASQEAAASLIGMIAEDDDSCADAIGKTQAITHFVQLLSSSNIGSRRASAWALRHLAAVDSNRIEMTEAGAIVPLVQLLREDFSGDEQGDDAQTAAAGALQNLAMNDTCSQAIAEAGGIPCLVKCLHDGTDFCKVVAAGALGTLGYNASNCSMIVQAGGIPALVKLLQGQQLEGQESAAVALYSVAVTEEYRVNIMEAGAIQPLVSMIGSEAPEAQEAATQALGALAKSQSCRRSICEMGAIPILVELLGSSESSMREEAARTIHNLALEPESQAPHILEAGAVEPLLMLLEEEIQDGDYDMQRMACQALAALSTHVGAADAILRAFPGLPSLLQLLQPPTPAVVQMLVAQTLAGCGANEELAVAMLDAGAISALLPLVDLGNESSQLWATRALLCIARVDSGSRALVSGGAVPVLLSLLHSSPTKSDALLEAVLKTLKLISQTYETGQRIKSLGEDGVYDVAGLLATKGEGVTTIAVTILSLMIQDNLETLIPSGPLSAFIGWITKNAAQQFHAGGRQAAQALCSLLRQPAHLETLLEAGCSAALLSILQYGLQEQSSPEEDALQVEVVNAVATLASQSETGRAAIVNSGAAEVLVRLLENSEGQMRNARVAALRALESLSVNNGACGQFVVAGVMDPLRRLLAEGNDQEVHLTTSILRHLQGQRMSGEIDANLLVGIDDHSDEDNELDTSTPRVVEEPQEDGISPR